MTRDEDAERRAAREIEHLRAVYQSLQQQGSQQRHALRQPETSNERQDPQRVDSSGPLSRRLGGRATLAVAGAAVLFVLGKAKFLGALAGVLKLKTLLTLVLSVAAYAIEWGVSFALGFVLLIFVHELGHALAMRREGIPAGAPVFIPFVGAFIAMQGTPRNAHVEARVAIAGPVVGSLAAWLVLFVGLALESRLLGALGHTGVLINLFNLVPVPPLDGGRIAGVFTRTYWIAGYAIGIAALLVTGSPILLVVLVVGLWMLIRRWNNPVPGYDDVPPASRRAMALGYAALVVALLLTLPLGHDLAGRAAR